MAQSRRHGKHTLHRLYGAGRQSGPILEDMVVARACKGRHIGSALLDYAVSQTKEKGCKRVTLLADGDSTRAHRFYEQKVLRYLAWYRLDFCFSGAALHFAMFLCF